MNTVAMNLGKLKQQQWVWAIRVITSVLGALPAASFVVDMRGLRVSCGISIKTDVSVLLKRSNYRELLTHI